MKAKWLDNLIPLHTRYLGIQYAGWKPTKFADENLGCILYSDVYVPMPDGVRLSADIYTPKKKGRYPSIVQFSAYNRDLHTVGMPTGTNEIGSPPNFTNRGYNVVVLTARGVGRSEGQLRYWQCDEEVDDHFHAIQWVSEQSWCDGQIALFGSSYYGMSQVNVAVKEPPALKAFFANEVCTDYFRHVFHYAGLSANSFMSLWAGSNFTEKNIKRYIAPWKRALLSHFINHSWTSKLGHTFINYIYHNLKDHYVAKEALPFYEHILFDLNTREENVAHGPFQALKNIHIPFVVVQNRTDIALHQFGAYDLFEHSATPENKKWLIINRPEYELPVLEWQLEAAAFFDYIIKGLDNGYQQRLPVRYWVDGEERFEGSTTFPPENTAKEKWYFSPNALSKTVPEESDETWVNVPPNADIVKNINNMAAQTLEYELTVDKTFKVAGPVTMHLKFSCNEIDSFVVVRVDRIESSGKSSFLTMGHIRAATRSLYENYSSKCEVALDTSIHQPLQRGVPVLLSFSLMPTAALFKKGDKMVISIGSRTDYVSPTPKEGIIAPQFQTPFYFCRNKIYYGSETYIEFNVEKGQVL
ncbi:Cocaine esterase [Legionella donaldsonii]|uniref:Cocaine esterase n=1 Tax=Legionella donaldsonii TaxID=45060 RepID=A0A378J3C5_9GAMM|nr:CocE/NonD family hydrolase [Legionella donaldsonii]STX41427.1 Cocaine esterase [Legionella donaldsonii]